VLRIYDAVKSKFKAKDNAGSSLLARLHSIQENRRIVKRTR